MKNSRLIVILLIITLVMTACDKKNDDIPKENEFQVYYINTKTSVLISERYLPISTTKEQQVQELFSKLKQAPEDLLYKSAVRDNIVINNINFGEDGRLTLDFDPSYSELTGVEEILCRASIVKTLCQIEGVEYIEFNVSGQRLMDSNGEAVGYQFAEDFIQNTGSETNYKVSLYFSDKSGTSLIESVSDIYYDGTGTIEELVIRQLINGPTEAGMYLTIPEGTVLINVTTKEGICYVDFNEKFLEKVPISDDKFVSDEVAIFSVVNSLVELPNLNINKVQFLINGELRKTYRELDGFDGFFERNLKVIRD